MVSFSGKIVCIGCGSIAQCLLGMLHSFIDIPPHRIIVIDFVDNREKIKPLISRGLQYIMAKLTETNYQQLLQNYVSPGDLLIDLAWNIDTGTIIDWCHQRDVCYINTSVELWEPYREARKKSPAQLTLYYRQMRLQETIRRWNKKNPSTIIVDHGANPGLVSHFVKRALIEIAQAILPKAADPRKSSLERALEAKDFAQLAYLTGVKAIHISERDTQITNQPKRPNEFVNTWSVEGFIEEGKAPSEMGWGTHETQVPKGAFFHETGPGNQIFLPQMGIHTWVKSWVPSGPITGMVIRHGEAFSISQSLTLSKDNAVVYRPTVHYAYCPCDCAINSLHELEMRHFTPQPQWRILADEIIAGKDELGCLLMGHDFGAWWIGSVLDIHEARRLVPGQNATSVQVAVSVAAAAVYAIEHPHQGFCLPDAIDHEEILKLSLPYLGEFYSMPVKWSPLEHAEEYALYGAPPVLPEDPWQFSAFLIPHQEFVPLPQSAAAAHGVVA